MKSLNNIAQSTIEYVLMMVVIISVLMIILNPLGSMTQTVNQSVEVATQGIECMADNTCYQPPCPKVYDQCKKGTPDLPPIESGPGPGPTPPPTPPPAPPLTTSTISCTVPSTQYCDLNHTFETQPTLLGYDRISVNGRIKFQFYAHQDSPSIRGGNLGAAWQDSGGQCTNIQITLVSYNGTTMNKTTGFGGTPQLTYKLFFPGNVAPAGDYVFEVEADSSSCSSGQGKFELIWTK